MLLTQRKHIWQVDAFSVSVSAALIGMFLITLGGLLGLIEYFVDFVVQEIAASRNEVLSVLAESDGSSYSTSKVTRIQRLCDLISTQVLVYTAIMFLFTLMAFILTLWRPSAAGSGIPEMRYILQSTYTQSPDAKKYLGDVYLLFVKVRLHIRLLFQSPQGGWINLQRKLRSIGRSRRTLRTHCMYSLRNFTFSCWTL